MTARFTCSICRVVREPSCLTTTERSIPSWAVIGIQLGFGQPFSEAGLSQAHPLSDLKPVRKLAQDRSKLVGRKIAEQLSDLLGRKVNHQFGHAGFPPKQDTRAGD